MSDQLHVSLNELDALVRKAARGACLPWGIAEEAGGYARRLAAWGVDPVAIMAGLLERHHTRNDLSRGVSVKDGTYWHSDDDRLLSVLVVAPTLCDHARWLADGNVAHMNVLAWPMILLPAVYRAARMSGRPIGVEIDGERWTATPDGRVSGEVGAFTHTELAADVVVQATDSPHAARTPMTTFIGMETYVHNWERLERIAAETYVPASERSRATGAGAGDIDND